MHAIGLRTKLLIGTLGTICKRWVHFSKYIAQESGDFIIQGNLPALKPDLLNHIKTAGDIEYISILGNDGKVLAHTFEKIFPEDLKEANILQPGQKHSIQHLTMERGNVFDIAVPILKGKLGVARLGFSEDPVKECIADITMVLVWIIVGASILTGTLSFSLTAVVTKPINKFITSVNAIGNDDPGYRVDIGTGDEIGRLAAFFNNMVEDLNKAKDELKKTNTKLKSKIMEHMKTEEALKDSEEMWRSLVENAPDIIFTVDRQGKIMFTNRVPEGMTAEESIGRNAVDLVAPEYRDAFRQSIQSVFETGNDEYYEICARGPYDKRAWHSTRLGPIKHKDQVVAVMLITRDITESKQLEKMVLEIEEQERERIGRDLHDDLGQICTGIAFKCLELEGKLTAKSSPEAANAAEIAKLIDNAKNRLRLIAQGFLPVETNKDGLMAALEELAYKTESMFGISCAFKCDKPVPVYNKAAIINLYRIAQEAVTNAVRHSKAGHIEIALNKDDDKIMLIIKDNGTGMPEISGQQSGYF
jgi:PAS domain S-box-containing protein